MHITGIIAEYNPFHNGHAYQLARARKETGADYIIVVMGGNFMQRGAPALLDKYTRAKMALLSGADLVIELPALWATASAGYFASAGVALCGLLGCIGTLCYGCETPSNRLFGTICGLLCRQPPQYQQLLSDALKTGASYALARETAILTLLGQADRAAAVAILRNPNNILALEYQMAIARENASIEAHPLLRKGSGYHCGCLSGPFVSASAIRGLLARQEASSSKDMPHFARQAPDDGTLGQAMPLTAYRLLMDYRSRYPFLYENDCSQMLHYCLLKNAANGFSSYADCPSDFSNKICRKLEDYTGFSDFCTLLKSKDMAYTRISRILLHILLDIRQSDYAFWRSQSYVPYAKILGLRKSSDGLLSHLKKHCEIPLLARASDAKRLLAAGAAYRFYEKSLFADSVYRALVTEKGGSRMKHELRQEIAMI